MRLLGQGYAEGVGEEQSHKHAISMDVRASSRPGNGVAGCVCPVLIEGIETVVAL